MKPDRAAIRKYFAKLGLDEDIADMYLALHEYGPQSISELSRNSGVERTRVYRLIDQLLESNLVELDAGYTRGVLKAAPVTNLNILIQRKAQELEGLQDELELIQQVLARNSLSSPAARVQFYYGAQGVKQLFWNISRARGEVRGIVHGQLGIKPDSRFFGRWAAACNEHSVQFRLTANHGLPGFEKLKHLRFQLTLIDVMPVHHTTFIYDDVTVQLNWKDEEIFGIETYNKEIAEGQANLFNLLWHHSPASNP